MTLSPPPDQASRDARALPYIVRQGRAVDIPALTRMWLESARQHAAEDPEFYGLVDDPLPAMRGYWENVIGDPSRRVFIAETAPGALVGCLQADLRLQRVFARPARGNIANVWVTPEFRRRGVGRALMAAATDWLRREGAAMVVLNVGAGNRAALDFYRALGYRIANLNLVRLL